MKKMTAMLSEKIEKMTEKAVFVNLEFDSQAGRFVSGTWFPKSQIEIEGDRLIAASEWIIGEKNADMSKRKGFWCIALTSGRFQKEVLAAVGE